MGTMSVRAELRATTDEGSGHLGERRSQIFHTPTRRCTILEDKIGFTRCQHDNTVYFKHLSDGRLLIIFIHVDNTSLIAPNCQMMQTLKNSIKSHLEITDGSELHWTLGIEVGHNREN